MRCVNEWPDGKIERRLVLRRMRWNNDDGTGRISLLELTVEITNNSLAPVEVGAWWQRCAL